MPPADPTDPKKEKRAQAKRDLKAYLAKRKGKRAELQEWLDNRSAKRRERRKSWSAHSRTAIQAEEEVADRKRKAIVVWREKQGEQAVAIEKMKEEKLERERWFVEQQEKREEYRRKKKEYLKSLRWAATRDRLQKKREMKAKDMRRAVTSHAEHTARIRKETIHSDERKQQQDIQKSGRKQRGDLDGEEKGMLRDLDEEFRKRKQQIVQREQNALQNCEHDYKRRIGTLPQIKDQTLLTRTHNEFEREWEKEQRRIKHRFQKQFTDLEVARRKAIDQLRREKRKDRENVTVNARTSKWQAHKAAEDAIRAVDLDLRNERHAAKRLEKQILSESFAEALEHDTEDITDRGTT